MPKIKHIGKTIVGNSTKRGCQQCFVVKGIVLELGVVHVDLWEHRGSKCSRGTLPPHDGQGLLVHTWRGLVRGDEVEDCPNADVWFVAYANHESTHKRGAWVGNGVVIHDTFLLPSIVSNICHIQAKGLWEGHVSNPISARMWTYETHYTCSNIRNTLSWT